jgi:hypothetical protein
MKEAFDDGSRTATTKQHDWKRKMKDCPEAEDGAEDDLMCLANDRDQERLAFETAVCAVKGPPA